MMTISDDDFETADRTRLSRECTDLRKQLAVMTKRAETAEQAYAELANDRTAAYAHVAHVEQERDVLRKALGSRGDAECPKCQGKGAVTIKMWNTYETDDEDELAAAWQDVNCDCRKRLGLTT